MIKYTTHTYFTLLFLSALFLLAMAPFALAQTTESNAQTFEAKARAVDAVTLNAGKSTISIWGINIIEGVSASFFVRARTTLDNVIGAEKVRCELKSRNNSIIVAQCLNSNDIDLGLHMLQNGFAIVDRSLVYGTIFEEPYIQAETRAQKQKIGIWADNSNASQIGMDNNLILIVGLSALLIILAAFGWLALTIMRGFRSVSEAQSKNIDIIARERELKNKEREIFATMLDSEIKANKSKIEAYMIVYDEMLKDIKNSDKTPNYKKAGDIVQAQPSLDRFVFDRNTDKLDILGNNLSSKVVHFYARIKTKPDYINLEPDMPIEKVTNIIGKAYENADTLNTICDGLIDSFAQGGHAQDDHKI